MLGALALPGGTLGAQTPVPQSDRIDTLPIGSYECTLPGDAAGPAWNRVPEHDFSILNGSSYEARGERGVYLLRGDEVIFTRGPLKGKVMERAGRSILRERLADGTLGRMRCVRAGPAN
ncbi:MAG: hypothetical protein CL808_04425 [Citromicrobium sp.]|nr:hypothetical protein [Citromicrobium sp.]